MDFKVTFFTTFSHCRGPSAFKPILISCQSSRNWDILLFNVNDLEFTDYSYICAPQRVNILAWHDQSCCVDRMRMTGRILELIGWQFQRSIPRDGQFWLGPVHLQLLFLSMYIQWFTSSVVCVLETGFVKFISVPMLNMPLMPFEGGEMICVLKYSGSYLQIINIPYWSRQLWILGLMPLSSLYFQHLSLGFTPDVSDT